ncbi:drug resistance transporter, EmrB/QacA subfamily [Amycolatopsis xylanica]|uniref:Drug resistance transporter, EmrB/QacA subfamily n=1 Tax=Amycolatopsis xylanica TaxID=589385 RepID=A0A1H3S816_9PSEU|nr:MFS transporter [Amycolatopsis xylanica]SDZ34112.1 drug resistance transporter, EmrB/QacA subfamily [Amycolatopsis xylanica]
MTKTLEPDRAVKPGIALAVISAATLMSQVDTTIVNVALPGIQRSLGFSGSGLEWVVTAYALAFGGLLLLGGRAGDLLGHRRVFLSGIFVFTVASAAGGFATAPWWLILCRALQGIGGAAAVPTALALIAVTFPEGPPRARAIGVYSAVVTAGGGLGLLAGGLVSTYLSWHWVMWVNVPVGVAVVLIGGRVLAETEGVGGRLDLPGALTGTLGITLLVYGLITGATDHSGVAHWQDGTVVAALVCAVVVLAAFVVIENRTPHALVPLRIFADRVRSGVLVVSVLTTTATFGLYFFLTIFLQDVWHFSPFQTALVYLPLTGAVMAGIRLGSWSLTRTGPFRLIIAGEAVAAAGLCWLSWLGGATGDLTGLLVPALLTHVGLGFSSVPMTVLALRGVAPGESGLVSGLLSAAKQVGGATGLAVLGTVIWATAVSSPGAIANQALAVGVSRGIAVACGLMVLATLIAVATMRRGGKTARHNGIREEE